MALQAHEYEMWDEASKKLKLTEAKFKLQKAHDGIELATKKAEEDYAKESTKYYELEGKVRALFNVANRAYEAQLEEERLMTLSDSDSPLSPSENQALRALLKKGK